jgi:two-component system alkaline phosphatase synthesis response regulator PhoP
MDGMTFLCELRQISMVPVIVMSAKLEEFDKIAALNAGADEYITKPVGMREVVARVHALIRRVNNMPTFGHLAPQNQINAFSFDEQRRTVFLNNEPVPLTNTEYKIIIHMLKNTGKIITRQEFGKILYGSDAIKIDRSIDMHIKNIRSKIESDLENPIYIMTVYGVGYRMNTPVAQ